MEGNTRWREEKRTQIQVQTQTRFMLSPWAPSMLLDNSQFSCRPSLETLSLSLFVLFSFFPLVLYTIHVYPGSVVILSTYSSSIRYLFVFWSLDSRFRSRRDCFCGYSLKLWLFYFSLPSNFLCVSILSLGFLWPTTPMRTPKWIKTF